MIPAEKSIRLQIPSLYCSENNEAGRECAARIKRCCGHRRGAVRKTIFCAAGMKKRAVVKEQWCCGRDNLRAVRVHLTPGRVSLMRARQIITGVKVCAAALAVFALAGREIFIDIRAAHSPRVVNYNYQRDAQDKQRVDDFNEFIMKSPKSAHVPLQNKTTLSPAITLLSVIMCANGRAWKL
jgi:hypothetical protein